MRKGGEMNVLMLACAGGILAALVAVTMEIRRMRGYRGRLDRHLRWHDMEAASRHKAMVAIDETLASLDGMIPSKKPAKKPATIKGGKKS